MTNEEKYKNLILSLAYSATLCDNMGDMWNDINKVLEEIGEKELANADHDYDEEDEENDDVEPESEFTKIMKSRGIKTVWGSD